MNDITHDHPSQIRRVRRAAITLALCLLGVLWIGTQEAESSDDPVDLQALYPSARADHEYLEGNNWITGQPERSVLWFRERVRGYWSQYNWAPDDLQADCNEDRFRWHNGELRYLWTDNECRGQDVRTRYKPAVTYMPSSWVPGTEWSRCGRSTVTHTDHRVVVRSGTTVWCSRIVGVVELQPGRPVVQVDVWLATIWDGEDIGTATHWDETLYLDPEFGLARHVGGNRNGQFNWSVWFTHWAPLPAGVSS
jgi:hypothetical protein